MNRKDWSKVGEEAFLYSQQLDGFVEALADWVECQALTRPSAVCDKTTLKSALKIDPWEPPSNEISISHDQLAEEVFSELAQRTKDYIGRGYPFECDNAGRVLKFIGGDTFPYVFRLALSYSDPTRKPKKSGIRTGAYILEALAWEGLQRFIGTPPAELLAYSHCHHFGSPSLSLLPGRFDKKINVIASQFNEGVKYRGMKSGHVQKSGDNGVDVLLRRGFPDNRGAQFLFFGACAAGKDWATTKQYECHPKRWLDRNFHQPYQGFDGMARCYFVPRQVSSDAWKGFSTAAGMLVDRCRLSLITCKSNSPYLAQARNWTEAMYRKNF